MSSRAATRTSRRTKVTPTEAAPPIEPVIETPAVEARPVTDHYLVGYWSGLANYGCPFCTFTSLEGPGTIELHILAMIDAGNVKHMEALRLTGGS